MCLNCIGPYAASISRVFFNVDTLTEVESDEPHNAYLGVSWAICSGVLPKMFVPVLDGSATYVGYVVGKIEEIVSFGIVGQQIVEDF